MPVAIITGASRGLGLALGRSLSADGWDLVVDAREPRRPRTAAAARLGPATARPGRRRATSPTRTTGPHSSPPRVELGGDRPARQQRERARSVAPTAARRLPARRARPRLRGQHRRPARAGPARAPPAPRAARRRSSTSPPTPRSSRTRAGAATDRRRPRSNSSATCSRPRNRCVHVYTFDPGDMRTQMHQEAFPGEDISDRPEPETVVPALRRLLHDRPASGRLPPTTDLAPAVTS